LLNSEGINKAAEDLFKPFRPEPKAEVSVELMLQEALGILGGLPDIDIRVNLASDLPKVTVQVQKVTSYITELLNNAIKFTRTRMEEKGIDRGQIEVGGRLGEYGFVELNFTNHGPPIPRERWEEIFKLFSAREEEALEQRSYGLGLWGARTTMRNHGGDVCVLASNEEMTIFLLRLPAQREEG
jgi:signal transduction histidine kinase